MAKLRVAIISSASSGLAHYVAHLTPEMRDKVDPTFITYEEDGKSEDELLKKVFPHAYHIIKNQSAQSILDTLKLLKEKRIEIINVHIGTTARKMWLHYAALLSQAKLLGIPVVVTLHDVLPFESFYVDTAAVELLYSLGTAYLVGNESEQYKLSRYFKIPKSEIKVVHHGVYTGFDRHKYTQASARKALGLPKDAPVILFFGYLKPHKGLKYLIKAFSAIVKQHPDALLLIASDSSYSPQLNEYLDRIETSGVAKNVKLVREHIRSFEVEKYFKAATMTVLPYTQVSQSGILNLAYAFRTPVVVTNIFADAPIIDGNFGRVVSPGRITSLAQAINELIDKPNMVEKYRHNLDEWVKKQHIWRDNAETSIDLFELLHKAAQRRS